MGKSASDTTGTDVDFPQSDASRTVALRTPTRESVNIAAEELRELSYEALVEAFGPTVSAEEAIGTDQFGPILTNKDVLVGKPFVAVHWEFHQEGKFGEFVSMWVLVPPQSMGEAEQRYIVNDGSTGIYQQLRDYTDKTGADSMLICRHGLRASQYTKEVDGNDIEAVTYYIDTKL